MSFVGWQTVWLAIRRSASVAFGPAMAPRSKKALTITVDREWLPLFDRYMEDNAMESQSKAFERLVRERLMELYAGEAGLTVEYRRQAFSEASAYVRHKLVGFLTDLRDHIGQLNQEAMAAELPNIPEIRGHQE